MSDTSIVTHLPLKPRVIIEQSSDGSLIMEYYIDGQRSRVPLNLGFELFEIKDALKEQDRRIASAAERKAQAKLLEETRRHNRVWNSVAYGTDGRRGHGVDFANRTVNGVKSLKHNAKVNEKEKPKTIEKTTLKAALALLD